MKKTLIISGMALCFSLGTINAETIIENNNGYSIQVAPKVDAFCTSIARGDIETVKKLIDLGADVNKLSNGMSPAMYAAKYNRTEILKVLISEGADLKKKSRKRMTAKKYAEQSNAQEVLILIESELSKKA